MSKIIVDGIEFDSKKEADYYATLKMLKMCGRVEDFDLRVKFELQPKYTNSKGQRIRAINFLANFVVTYIDGHIEVVTINVPRTKENTLKRKMFEYVYPKYLLIEE